MFWVIFYGASRFESAAHRAMGDITTAENREERENEEEKNSQCIFYRDLSITPFCPNLRPSIIGRGGVEGACAGPPYLANGLPVARAFVQMKETAPFVFSFR